MRTDAERDVAERLLRRFGCTIADQIGADPRCEDGLFELLGASLLTARRVNQSTGIGAWLALRERGWSTPAGLVLAPWKQRVRALDESGYIRSPERMSLLLGSLADGVIDRYEGDVGNVRAAASHDPEEERRLLTEIKGVHDGVVDVFFREVQVEWDEVFPFADEPVLEAADRMGLPPEPQSLAEISGGERFPRLVGALAHVQRVDAFHALAGDDQSAQVIDLRMEQTTKAMRGAS